MEKCSQDYLHKQYISIESLAISNQGQSQIDKPLNNSVLREARLIHEVTKFNVSSMENLDNFPRITGSDY